MQAIAVLGRQIQDMFVNVVMKKHLRMDVIKISEHSVTYYVFKQFRMVSEAQHKIW